MIKQTKQEGLKKITDPRLNSDYNMEKLERMVKVLPCVAENRDGRPPKSKAVWSF